jgi:3-phenylpropionate/trans-cinnamate dioxygenase ferredoxin reductase subunit
MSGPTELSGPDLRVGIASTDLAEGATLVGHADGEAVLLARVGGAVHALAATCTHYGGPLGEGLLVGETVRCPWHHACFSLRTGAAVRPPALNDLAVWEVEEVDGRVRVLRKIHEGGGMSAALRESRRPSSAPSSVVIVGAGAAGDAAAETLRREGYQGPVTMIDADDGAPCDRPNLSKDYLAGTAPEEWIPLHPPEFYEQHGIEIVRDVVESLDARRRTLTLRDGSVREYGALILAPGAEPVRLPIAVAEGAPFHYLRTLADSRALIAAAQSARRAVVIGASFIGLEVAASLRHRGIDVVVVAPEAHPLERVLGRELGAFIRRVHEANGVLFHLGHTVGEVLADGVVLDDGTRLDGDLVVAGVGVRPRVDLARGAGLAVDNGIVVNEFLATAARGVYAAGDAARFPDARTGEAVRVEHWVLAQRHGQAAARNVLGARARFEGVPFFWSQHYDVVIAYVGHASRWDRVQVEGDPDARDATVTYWRVGRRLAVATIFRDRESLRTEVAMEAEAVPGSAASFVADR